MHRLTEQLDDAEASIRLQDISRLVISMFRSENQ
jgi:hypothetical protein